MWDHERSSVVRLLTEQAMVEKRRATSFELLRDRNPTFAVGRGQRKVFFQAVASLRAFRRTYRQTLEQWRAGLRSVVFPQGTWWMCQVHGAVGQTSRVAHRVER